MQPFAVAVDASGAMLETSVARAGFSIIEQFVAKFLFIRNNVPMSEKHCGFPATATSPATDDLQRAACEAVAAIVEAGARILASQPWRVRRIVGDADALTCDELAARVAQRRGAARPCDPNSAIALAQLSRALHCPSFREGWERWRNDARDETAPASDALCE
jgi:hypothetical protein